MEKVGFLLLFCCCFLSTILVDGTELKVNYLEPHCGDKQVIVHLFEWSWNAIANECEKVLGPKGYCGVQISPPNEHIDTSEWWARYQPVSYKLVSRSGTRAQLADMIQRCNKAGVNVFADAVINHMSYHTQEGVGIGGSPYDGVAQEYPIYSSGDFHQPPCEINNYKDPTNVRNCYLETLNDLDGGKDYVRKTIAAYFNDLLDLGVKGFRVDASKHMWPQDLEAIQGLVKKTVDGKSPFFYHEVIGGGDNAITPAEYIHLGKVTEFRAGLWIYCIRNGDLSCLNNFGSDLGGLLDGIHAVAFVDNHDNQRHGDPVLTYKDSYNYKLGVGFLLAHEYGFKRVMSSYSFTDGNAGPPETDPPTDPDQDCHPNGWICEHRWSSIMNMVQFTNTVQGTGMGNYQLKDKSLGFSRGTKGFFAMGDLNNVEFYTGLPDGEYCDIIHECSQKIRIENGKGIFKKAQADDPIVAICVGCE